MKIKKGYIKTEALDGFVVVPVEEESKTQNFILSLNGTASQIWDMLSLGKAKEQIVSALVDAYGIPESTAAADTDRIISTLKEHNILED